MPAKYSKNPAFVAGFFLKWTTLGLLCGGLAGLAGAIFLHALQWSTETREMNFGLIWLLPFAGFFIGWTYKHYGQSVAPGTHLIIDEIHDPQKVLPARMTPLILLSTLLTHLTGGSAGREGTAVQMGASLADQLGRVFKVQAHERKILLMSGLSAGFGAALGTPLAGMVFGLEVIRAGQRRWLAAYPCWVASFGAFFVAQSLKAPHSHFPKIDFAIFDLKNFFSIMIAGIFFGLSAQLFIRLTRLIEKSFSRFISYSPLRPFFGGILLVIFYWLEASYRFTGLGIPEIQKAFHEASPITDPIYKAFFTALTIGSGFKGGEFIPLVFVGTTLGSALTSLTVPSLSLLVPVGFASVFAGASKTPLACAIMAAELFGWPILHYALAGCFVSSFFSGRFNIYSRH